MGSTISGKLCCSDFDQCLWEAYSPALDREEGPPSVSESPQPIGSQWQRILGERQGVRAESRVSGERQAPKRRHMSSEMEGREKFWVDRRAERVPAQLASIVPVRKEDRGTEAVVFVSMEGFFFDQRL